MYFPIIAFFSLFAVVLIVRSIMSSHDVKRKIGVLEHNAAEIILRKNDVACETNIIGRRTNAFRFSTCDLIVKKSSLTIIGYSRIGKMKIAKAFITLTNGFVPGYGKIKKLNLNSFGNDVYIEFGDAGFFSTSIEIRLKNLSEEEKKLIHIE